jgi:hypothetical protein
MNMNRREVMNRDLIFGSWLSTHLETQTEGLISIMIDEKNAVENAFDFEIQKAPEKGKPCHMQVDEDLHKWLNDMRIQKDVTFRKFANMLLCKGIQQYIKAKKLPSKIRDRSN